MANRSKTVKAGGFLAVAALTLGLLSDVGGVFSWTKELFIGSSQEKIQQSTTGDNSPIITGEGNTVNIK
jgi:hypothetical protein